MSYNQESVGKGDNDKSSLRSVRCLQDLTYTLACANVPASVPPGTAITSGLNWKDAPTWTNPAVGTYNVSATASCGGSSKTASCGTLTVNTVSSKGNDIANYKTVQIGDQVWMAENLDYYVSGSKCYGGNVDNCATYGRLYNWVTTMSLPSSCNTNSCALQVNEKHRGICPSGWHIPSYDEWNILSTYVQNDKECTSCAAKHLKAASGWNSSGNGLDSYGFAALPGGYGTSAGFFGSVGDRGSWWSTENNASNASSAWFRIMDYNYEYTSGSSYDKDYLRSVRCVQD